MASTVLNAPNSVRRTNGLDCGSYVGLIRSPNSNFLCVRTSTNVRSPRLFVVRASDERDAHMKKLGRSDAECEAAVVAGNVPEAPPVPPKPASPAGTPVVPLLVSVVDIAGFSHKLKLQADVVGEISFRDNYNINLIGEIC